MTLALYVPRASPVHRTPAGWKLLALAGLSLLVFAVPTLPVVTGALVGTVGLGVGVARLPAAVLARQARAMLWFLVALFVLHSLVTDVLTGALTTLRLLALVLAAAVVTATTRVTALVAVVEWLAQPLRIVGVRPARVGLVIALTLRFIPVVAEQAAHIREAQAARGAERMRIGMLVPLLIQVLRLAHTLSEALDARGADDAPARSRRRRLAASA
jgi:biotin transport system permease protein